MKSRFFFGATALMLTGLAIQTPMLLAQTPSSSTPSVANIPQTITLADAIRAAIERNYTVRQSGNAARREDIEVTRSIDNAWLPTAGATGSWGYNYSLLPLSDRTLTALQSTAAWVQTTAGDSLLVKGIAPNAPVEQVITPAGSHSLKWDASIGYNIFNGGSDVAAIHVAQATFGADTNNFFWTRQITAFTVTRDYITVLDNNELVVASDSTLAEGLAQLALVQGQYQAGVVPIGNVYQQEAVVEQDSLALIQARNNYQNSRATLLYDLNIPPNLFQNYTLSVEGLDTTTSLAARSRVDTTITDDQLNNVINNRPDIIAQEQNIQASEFTVDITRGHLLPSLDASAGIGGAGTNTNLSGIQMNNGLSVGLSLSIPLFDAMQYRLLIQQQEIDVANARITLEQDVQQIRNAAITAINNLKAADQALEATESELTTANESLRLASERLRVGAGTEVDVIVAEAAVETARVNRVNAKYNWVLAQQQLAYTLGQWNY